MTKKEEMRKKYLKQRSEFSDSLINNWSQKIKKNFLKIEELQNAKKIMAYASMRNEIKTFSLLEELLNEGYTIYLPYTKKEVIDLGTAQINDLKNDLQEGVFGVQEPIKKIRDKKAPSDLDIIIVPGLCFSKNGYRIGYGGGYYDSFLSKDLVGAVKVGFCYDDFLVDSLPVEEHDIAVDLIITNKQIIKVD